MIRIDVPGCRRLAEIDFSTAITNGSSLAKKEIVSASGVKTRVIDSEHVMIQEEPSTSLHSCSATAKHMPNYAKLMHCHPYDSIHTLGPYYTNTGLITIMLSNPTNFI